MLFGQGAVPPESRELFLREHATRLTELDLAAREGQPGPVELDALQRYAALLGRSDLARHWSDQLVRQHPRHGAAALVLQQSIARSLEPSRTKLDVLDDLWDRIGAPTIAQVGLRISMETADSVRTGEWLERHSANSVIRDLSYDTEIARDMVVIPALGRLTEAWIVERLADSRAEMGRARRLDQSRRNFQAESGHRRALLNLYLAQLYHGRGEVGAALRRADRSVEQAWSPEVFIGAAEIHRAVGSDSRATQLTALALVDPIGLSSRGLSPAALEHLPEPSDTHLTAARSTMYERLTPSLLDEPVRLDVRLRTATDDETTLQTVVSGRLALVVQAFRPDFVRDETLDLLDATSEKLRAAGVETLLIAQRPSPASLERPGLDRRFLRDPGYEAWDSLRAWRELQYFVLDSGGKLRYRGEDLETALRISLVLSTEKAALGSAVLNRKESGT